MEEILAETSDSYSVSAMTWKQTMNILEMKKAPVTVTIAPDRGLFSRVTLNAIA